MGRSYLKVYCTFEEDTACLNDSERERLLLAMVRYAKDKTVMTLPGNERFLWPMFKAQIDRDTANYNTWSENGAKGGRPPKNQNKPNENQTEPNENQNKPNETQKNHNKDKDKDEDKDKDKDEIKRFAPPTPEEVRKYCLERGNHVDPDVFVDFYASKGWKVGNQPMKDWRACVRTWEKEDRGKGHVRAVPAQAYSQRDYSGEQEEAMNRMLKLMDG